MTVARPSKEQIQLPNELAAFGVVNIRIKFKAQRVKYISSDGGGAQLKRFS